MSIKGIDGCEHGVTGKFAIERDSKRDEVSGNCKARGVTLSSMSEHEECSAKLGPNRFC